METTKDTKTKNRFPNKSSEQRIAIQYQHKYVQLPEIIINAEHLMNSWSTFV